MNALTAYLLGRCDLAEAMNTIIVPGDVTHTWGPNPVAAGQVPAGLDGLPAAGFAVANPIKRLFPHHNMDVRDSEENTTVCVGQLIAALNTIEKAGDSGIPGITPSELALSRTHLIAHAQMLVSDRPDYIAPDPNRGKYDGEVIYNIKPSNDPGVRPRVTTVPMGEAIDLKAGESLSDFQNVLRQALIDKFGEDDPDEYPRLCVDSVFGDQVVFCQSGWDGPLSMTTWARGASGEFIFTPPVEVERVTTFRPKPSAKPAEATDSEQTTKRETVTPLIPVDVAERDLKRNGRGPMALHIPAGTKDEAAYVRAIEIAAKQGAPDLFGEQGAIVSLIRDGCIVAARVAADDLEGPTVTYHELPLKMESSRYVVGSSNRLLGTWTKRGDPPEWEWR